MKIIRFIIPLMLLLIPVKAYNTTTFIDTSERNVEVLGEDVGYWESIGIKGWYTQTSALSPDKSKFVTVWIRKDGTDRLYAMISNLTDTDGDGNYDSITKAVYEIYNTTNLRSLDSITITDNGFLVTWTEYIDDTYDTDVKACYYGYDGSKKWCINVTYALGYQEYSRSCYLNNQFIIVYYQSSDQSINANWYDTNGNLVTSRNLGAIYLDYQYADQIQLVKGNDVALLVYRYNYYGDIEIMYRSLKTDGWNSNQHWFNPSSGEDVLGFVAYNPDTDKFIIPVVTSNGNIAYRVIRDEDLDDDYGDSSTEWYDNVTIYQGKHPYATSAYYRFVLTWASSNGIKVGNVRAAYPNYIYVTTVSDSNTNHPIIADDGNISSSGKYVLVWTFGTSPNYEVKYAILTKNNPDEYPSLDSTKTLEAYGNQIAHGLSCYDSENFMIVYKDESLSYTGSDLLAYVKLKDNEQTDLIQLYYLPEQASEYKQLLLDLFDNTNAGDTIKVAMAFFIEPNVGESGSLSKALVDAKNVGVEVYVIMDDSDSNDEVYNYLSSNRVNVKLASGGEFYTMHDKFVIVKNSSGNYIVVSTSNFIVENFNQSNNTALFIKSMALTHFFEEEFDYMWNDNFGANKKRDHSFLAFVNEKTFEGYFNPQRYGDWKRVPYLISGYIYRSNETLFTAHLFNLANSVKPIRQALMDAYNESKKVRGIFTEEANFDMPYRAIYEFLSVPSMVSCFDVENHPYSMHNKLFAFEDVAIIGSYNPTGSSTINNDDYILVVKNDLAKQIHNHIQSLLDKYPSARGPYEVSHVIVNEIKIMGDLEWVELYNPLSTSVNLTDTANFSEYYIGDAENLTSDDEGLYHFPSNTEIPAHGYIVIANNGTLFYQTYGFYPDFEFEDTTTIVPDMIRYDSTNFTGTFNLDDLGDEVLLLKRIYAGHLQVLDAVWYGNSNYLTDAADITGLNENNTLQRVEDGLDAVTPNYVFVVGDPTPKSGKAKGTPPLDVRLEEYVSYTFNCTPNRCEFKPIDAYGYLNITNYDPTNNTFFDIWVSVNLSTSFVSVSKPPSTNVVITTNQNDVPSKYFENGFKPGQTYIYLSRLAKDERVSLKYEIPNYYPPIVVFEVFDPRGIYQNGLESFTVNMTLKLNESFPSGVVLHADVEKFLDNATGLNTAYASPYWVQIYFDSSPVTGQGSAVVYDGGYTSGNNDAINWTDIYLHSGYNSTYMKFKVYGNYSKPNSNFKELAYFGFARVNFSFDDTISGSEIVDVFARGPATVSAKKEGPKKNASGEFVLWNMTGFIKNTAGTVYYNVTTISVFAKSSWTTTIKSQTVHPYTWIQPSQTYTLGPIQFNYSGVPIVWANATFKMIEDVNHGYYMYHITKNGTYLIYEWVFVISGYYIKVTKHVIPNGTNAYDVILVVENIGNRASPVVGVYDLIPENFNVTEFMYVNKSSMLRVDGNTTGTWKYSSRVSNPIGGYAWGYSWILNSLNPYADGDGSFEDYDEISNNQSVIIHYKLVGTGDYRVSDVFVVGIDPSASFNPTSEKILVVGGVKADNYEIFMLMITLITLLFVYVRR